MGREVNYYEHHLGDYAEATAHLSFVEDAAYSRLMRKYYATEKPLPSDLATVQRLVGARTKEERAAVAAVLAEFFTLDAGGYRNTRCDAEIARFKDKQRKAKASADARWTHTERNANAMRTHSEGNAPSNQTPDTSKEKATSDEVAPDRPADDRRGLVLIESTKGVPDCPHGHILALWAEVLPALPQHAKWTAGRAEHLRARWRETAVEKRWKDAGEGIEFFRNLFRFVGRSAFLTGRARASDPNRKPFIAELAWLVQPENFAKVIEGKYHGEAA